MGRNTVPLHKKIDRAIGNEGDPWLKREGNLIMCLVCKHSVNYTEKSLGSRVAQHVRTKKHSDLVRKARKGNFRQSESEDDESVDTNLPNVKTYIARPDAEIAAALESVAQNGEKFMKGELDETSNDGQSADGSAVDESIITGSTRRDRCWNYMRLTGKQNSFGRDIYECIFCNFELRPHVSTFKWHLCRRCPGVPEDIKNYIKDDAKRHGKSFLKKKSHLGYTYMNTDETDIEEFEDDGLDDGVNTENKAVEILTKLLGQRDVEMNDEGAANGAASKSSKRGKVGEESEIDPDQELKDLQIKKMKAELRLINEKTASEELNRKETKVRIKEAEERTKLLTNINREFPSLLKIVHAISNPGFVGSVINRPSASGSNGNILQEAFSEVSASN